MRKRERESERSDSRYIDLENYLVGGGDFIRGGRTRIFRELIRFLCVACCSGDGYSLKVVPELESIFRLAIVT